MNNLTDQHKHMGRREFLIRTAGALTLCELPLGLASCAVSTNSTNQNKNTSSQQRLYWAWWGWEPLDHYLRAGGVVGAVNTRSPSLRLWYERLHSDEIVRMMADLGINLGVTHFFKGFGLVHERAEQQRTAQLVKFAHRHGIKILGYCQSRSIYHEQFLAEAPNAEDWIQRDEKGQLRYWGNQKYRWAPCIHCREFRDYMKRAIRIGLEEIGLDGLHFDNNYAQPCYCRRCEEQFRQWMARRRPDCHVVKQPATEKSPQRITDPVAQEWVRWRCESLADYQRELADCARRIKPDVLLLGNPGFPRRPDTPYANSVWAPWQGRHLDLMFAENSNFPGIEKGALISQVRAFKYGAAIGYRVVSTVWKHDKLTGLGLPETPEEIALQIAESAAAHNALPGTNWALRPLGDTDKMRVEPPDLREALEKYLRFVRAQEPLWQNAKPVRDVALLHTFASTLYDNHETFKQVHAAEEVLIRGGFAWEVLFDEHMDRLNQFPALVLAGQSLLSAEQIAAIRQFENDGGKLIVVGTNPAFDRSVPLSELASTIRRVTADRFSARLLGSDNVTLNAYELSHNRLIIHLVNYAATEMPPGVRLELGRRWQRSRRTRFLTPDGPERSLAVSRTMAIPPFKIYAVLEMAL